MTLLESFGQDIRVSFRLLAKSPAATALSVVSIAFGIGFATAIFSVADAAFFRPFPFEKPGEVLQLGSIGDDGREFMYGWPDYEDMVRSAGAIADLSAYQRRGAMLAGDEETQVILAYPVTPNHFAFLGIRAALGRASVDPIEGRPGVVLGNRLWQRKFGGDPAIVGKTVRLSGAAFVVSGVLPAEFGGLTRGVPNDVWVSTDAWFGALRHNDERRDREGQFEILARLKPGVTAERAAAQLDAAIRGAGKHKPAPAGSSATYLEARFALNWKMQVTAGAALAAVLGLILIVGSANAAQLRIAQAEARKRELSIRRALGAGLFAVGRLLLVETAMVSMAGAVFGLLLAWWLMEGVGASITAVLPYYDPALRLDSRAVIVSLAAAAASVLLAGLAPIRLAARLDVSEMLKSGQGVAGARTGWGKRALVVAQIAATVLFFGMSVEFIENARSAAKVRPGIDPGKRMFTMEVGPGWNWPAAKWCEEACDRLSAVPGVHGATFARRLPLSGSGSGMTARVEIPRHAPLGVMLNNVGGDYFSLMGTRVLAGRGIESRDRAGSPLVVVLSQQFVRQVFSGRNPMGEWISVNGKPRQVVGISEDGPTSAPSVHEAPAPYLYLPFAQSPSDDIVLIVETLGDPDALGPAIRKELKRFDPGVTVYSSTTLRRHMDQALALDRVAVGMATALGAVGFLLTGIGLFGVVQYAVNRRTREIGLRLALGARPGEIQKMVLGESLRLSAWGIPAGLMLLAAAERGVQSQMLGVTALDPLAYAASGAAAVAIALVAAWMPASRAARVDSMAALRME